MKLLYIYSGDDLLETINMSDIGDYEYYRVDKRIEVESVDIQVAKYITCAFRSYFHFRYGILDSGILNNLFELEALGYTFVLYNEGVNYTVVLDKKNMTQPHPASAYIGGEIVLKSINTYNIPILDGSMLVDTMYLSDAFSGSITVPIIAEDLQFVHIITDKAISYTVASVEGRPYSQGSGSDILASARPGMIFIGITGECSFLIIQGEGFSQGE